MANTSAFLWLLWGGALPFFYRKEYEPPGEQNGPLKNAIFAQKQKRRKKINSDILEHKIQVIKIQPMIFVILG